MWLPKRSIPRCSSARRERAVAIAVCSGAGVVWRGKIVGGQTDDESGEQFVAVELLARIRVQM
jgi:hypothetical protein